MIPNQPKHDLISCPACGHFWGRGWSICEFMEYLNKAVAKVPRRRFEEVKCQRCRGIFKRTDVYNHFMVKIGGK